jgi:hypothetical protein
MARRFGPIVEVQLRAALSSLGWPNADVMMLDPTPDNAQILAARERAEASGWVALIHFNRVQSFDPEAVETADQLVRLATVLAGAGVAPIVVSMGCPYALPLFKSSGALVCGYSTCDASLRATLEVLMGRSVASGSVPVELAGDPDLRIAI